MRQRLSVGRLIDNPTVEYAGAGCRKTAAGESIGEGRDVGGEVAHSSAGGLGGMLRIGLSSRQGCWLQRC